MSVNLPQSPAASEQPQHARELQARLYREIGLSAVAAALLLSDQDGDAEIAPLREQQSALRTDIAA
jgi:hypothetical protein